MTVGEGAGHGIRAGDTGPVHFYAEQARIRAEAWRVTALALLLAGSLGLVASMGVGPLLVALVAIVIRVLDAITFGLLAGLRDGLKLFIGQAFADFGGYANAVDTVGWLTGEQLSRLWRFSLLLLPGMALMVAGYVWVRQRISQHGDDAMVSRMTTQSARRGDPHEAVTLRLAEELAIAAGVATPTVLITETPGNNLATVGRDHQSWTLLATRGFVLQLSRQQQRGAIAIAVARIVNGDIATNTSIAALGTASGLLRTVLDWPVSVSARQRMRLLMGLKAGADAKETLGRLVAVEQRLQYAGEERSQELAAINHDTITLPEQIRGYVLLPFHAMSFCYVMLGGLFGQAVLGTAMGFALSWRLRQADAAAVRLISNADEVAQGLNALGGGIPDEARPWAHFFVMPSRPNTVRAVMADNDQSELALVTNSTTKEGRLRRLNRLGASGPVPKGVMDLPWYLLLLVGGLLATAGGLMAFLVGCFALFFAVFGGLFGYGIAYLVL